MSKRIRSTVLLFLWLLGVSDRLGHAQEESIVEETNYQIRRIYLEPLKGDRSDIEKIQPIFRRALEETYFFELVDRRDREGADALISGSIRRSKKGEWTVSVVLKDARWERPIGIESVLLRGTDDPVVRDGMARLAQALLSRLPAKATVTAVEGDHLRIDAGGFRGVPEGGSLSVYRIQGVDRHPFTDEIIGYQKLTVAKAEVVSVEGETARAKVVDRLSPIQIGDLVGYTYSEETASRFQALRRSPGLTMERPKPATDDRMGTAKAPREIQKGERGWMRIGWVFLENHSEFVSTGLNFERDVDFFHGVQIDAGVWIWGPIGLAAGYQTGWITFDQLPGGTTIKAGPSWILPRFVLRVPPFGPLDLRVDLGYSLYRFNHNMNDTLFFVDSRVQGPYLGLDLTARLNQPFTARLGAAILPFQQVREKPVESGTDGKALGVQLEIGGSWIFDPHWIIEVGYQYRFYDYAFDGAGNRGPGVLNAEATESYHGPSLAIKVGF